MCEKYYRWIIIFDKNRKTLYRFNCKRCTLRPECNLEMYKNKSNACPVATEIGKQVNNYTFGEAHSFFSDIFYLNCIQESPEIETILHEMGPKIKKYYQKQL